MNEALKVMPGEYLHQEKDPYRVLGLARKDDENIDSSTFVGSALWVDEYEQTGKVGGEVQIFRLLTDETPYTYKPSDDVIVPQIIVFYQQEYKGLYPSGQYWVRSVSNFQANFTPLVAKGEKRQK